MEVPREVSPVKVEISALCQDPLAKLEFPDQLSDIERYVLLRALETGIVSKNGFEKMVELRQRYGTIGAALIYSGICPWETLLGYCLDTRPPSVLDPPSLRALLQRKEWELVGEILCAMGAINRTKLEYALKIKREGNQALGQILTAMGACDQKEIDHCLQIQAEISQIQGSEVALVGSLLVGQGIISEQDLADALRSQKVARQPLSKILVSMGACSQSDINGFTRVYGHDFQAEIDDVNLGNYLLKTEAITKTNLEEALRVQQRGRQVLGEMLISMGLCTAENIESVIELQREVRDTHRSGVEKLGSILIHCGKVPPAKIDEAVKLQSIGRQPLGAILIALGACTAKDVTTALEIQERWRATTKTDSDRLGEVLVNQGYITETQLEQPLLEHMREERPLGRILIEHNLCTPEQIIDALIHRDHQRQYEFLQFIRHCTQPVGKNREEHGDAGNNYEQKKNSIVGKLSNWFSKPTNE